MKKVLLLFLPGHTEGCGEVRGSTMGSVCAAPIVTGTPLMRASIPLVFAAPRVSSREIYPGSATCLYLHIGYICTWLSNKSRVRD